MSEENKKERVGDSIIIRDSGQGRTVTPLERLEERVAMIEARMGEPWIVPAGMITEEDEKQWKEASSKVQPHKSFEELLLGLKDRYPSGGKTDV